jgi:hypothetical protein
LVQGRLDKLGQAEQTWRRLLEIHDRIDGRGNQLAVMSNLAGVLNQQGKFAEAEPLLQQILPQLDGGIGKHSEHAIGMVRQLSLALGGQGRYEEEETMSVEGFEPMNNVALSEDTKLSNLKAMQKVKSQVEDWKAKAGTQSSC